MSLSRWLGEMPIGAFVEQYLHKLPHSLAGAGKSDCPLGSWETVGEILADRNSAADSMVVRQGHRYDGPPPTSRAAAEQLCRDGWTVLVKHAERHHAGLAELAAGFARDFAAPVNVHIYVTPGNQWGFPWHYDAEEVFILQTTGAKEYSLRKNTVNPWPLEETLPRDMKYEREIMPLSRCLLTAGDWIYIPAGYWHKAETKTEETAISLAVGVQSLTAVDLFDYLRPKLLDSLLWRQRLPIAGEASPLNEAALLAAYQTAAEQLADDLRRQLTRPLWLQEFVERQKPKA